MGIAFIFFVLVFIATFTGMDDIDSSPWDTEEQKMEKRAPKVVGSILLGLIAFGICLLVERFT